MSELTPRPYSAWLLTPADRSAIVPPAAGGVPGGTATVGLLNLMLPVDVVLDFRAVARARRSWGVASHATPMFQPHAPSSAVIVAFESRPGVAAGDGVEGRRSRRDPVGDRGLQQRPRIVGIFRQRGFDLLVVDADADCEVWGHLPRQCRVDVDRLDLRLERLIAADPAVVVLRRQAERHVDAKTERPCALIGTAM